MSERPSPLATLPDCGAATAGVVDARLAVAATATHGVRLHELDAMRSVLMLLGVVLHAINPYGLDGDWLVADASRSPLLEALAVAIHAFRMPAFFVVAGYFSMLLLGRQAPPVFLRERLRRTLLPALAVLLTFNLVQVWFLAPAAPADGFWRGALLPALLCGDWLGHLWFLVDLALYCIALAALRPWLDARAGGQGRTLLAQPHALPVLLAAAALVPLASAMAAHLAPMLARQLAGLVNPQELLDHAPFFAIGCLLQVQPSLLRRFSCAGAGVWIGAGITWAALRHLPEGGGPAAAAVTILARTGLAWCLVRMLFAGFSRWAGAPSPVFRYLSDASYSIYLFHHLCVVATASVLLSMPWAAPAKFGMVLAVAALVPLAMHHWLVRPHPTMRWLFNGRPRASALPRD
ncbi:acyltransferase family protein [Luteimonas sp. A482]